MSKKHTQLLCTKVIVPSTVSKLSCEFVVSETEETERCLQKDGGSRENQTLTKELHVTIFPETTDPEQRPLQSFIILQQQVTAKVLLLLTLILTLLDLTCQIPICAPVLQLVSETVIFVHGRSDLLNKCKQVSVS